MTTKQALLKAIEQLPEQQLIEVLHQHLAHAEKSTLSEPNPVSDPLQNSSAQCPTAPCCQLDELMAAKLFIDTWGWLTLHDKGERYHQQATQAYQQARCQKGQIFTQEEEFYQIGVKPAFELFASH